MYWLLLLQAASDVLFAYCCCSPGAVPLLCYCCPCCLFCCASLVVCSSIVAALGLERWPAKQHLLLLCWLLNVITVCHEWCRSSCSHTYLDACCEFT